MYKKIFVFILLALLLVLTACSKKENISITLDETVEEKPVGYSINQIVLSKGFQITDSNVDIMEKGTNLKLLVTAGLVESSGIYIDKITKAGNTLNIYLSREMDKNKIQLAVPQIILEINDDIKTNPENLKFNIIPQNYKPISLKFSKSQILDKISSELKIEPVTIPEVELYKEDDNILWNVYFSYMLDKENSRSPLFNLYVKADANTGKILETEKYNISTYLDHGHLLDYMPNKFLIYKQEHVENDIAYQSLWSYDLNNGERKKLYTTKYAIKYAFLSPDGKYVSLIEGEDESKSDIFLIKRSDKVAIKITPVNYIHPKLMKWKDENSLYFIDINNDTTTLFLYNIADNTMSKVLTLDKVIESFDIFNDKLIFAEQDQDSINKNLYLLEKEDDLKLIGTGFRPIIFNDKYITYLENIEDKNKNVLKLYNIDEYKVTDTLDYNILNYYKLDDKSLLFVESLNLNNQFAFGKYSIDDRSSVIISQINSQKVFYNPDNQKAYISLTIPKKEKNEYNIYSIDLTETYSSNKQ